jgi:tetratricopeptide (TPR) repeat protein
MSYIRKRKSGKLRTTPQEIIADEKTLMDWVSENVNTLIYSAGAILFILFVVFGVVWMKSEKRKAATEDLAGALGIYWSTMSGLPSENKESDNKKLEEALETFTNIAERHKKTLQGQSASLYRANILYRLGLYQDAALAIEELESRDAHLVSDINARYLLAKSYEAMGEYEKAIAVYSQLRERAISDMRAVLSIDLARCSELKGDLKSAVSLYREVRAGYPDSTFALRAEKKLAMLGAIDREML